jgi:hypothetical protein
MVELPITISHIDRIADAVERLAQIVSASRFSYQLQLEGVMPVYKADKPDFSARIIIGAVDSEGNVISDAPIPAGHTLTVTSDNPACITATQDTADPKLVNYHIGGPNTDGTPSQANVSATLSDPVGNMVGTGASQVTVTVGDPAAITGITVMLPEN